MPDEPPRRGRPRTEQSPTRLGELINSDRRSAPVTFALALDKMRRDGNGDLADEIQAAATRIDANKGRSWLSAVQHIARVRPEGQRWAWEQTQEHGARWMKRYVETQLSPPSPWGLSQSIEDWLSREYPHLDPDVVLDALDQVTTRIATKAGS